MEMFPVEGGKVEVNTANIVTAVKAKDGENWVIVMANKQYFTLTKSEYTKLRKLVNKE